MRFLRRAAKRADYLLRFKLPNRTPANLLLAVYLGLMIALGMVMFFPRPVRASRTEVSIAEIAYFTLALISLMISAMHAISALVRRRRDRRVGLCARCGYDLRGHVGARVCCPECGLETER